MTIGFSNMEAFGLRKGNFSGNFREQQPEYNGFKKKWGSTIGYSQYI